MSEAVDGRSSSSAHELLEAITPATFFLSMLFSLQRLLLVLLLRLLKLLVLLLRLLRLLIV